MNVRKMYNTILPVHIRPAETDTVVCSVLMNPIYLYLQMSARINLETFCSKANLVIETRRPVE